MSNVEKDVELTTIRIVKSGNEVGIFHKNHGQNAELFKWTAEDLEAPSASKKDALFDWQFENEGNKSIERFGGINELMKTLGTDEKSVCLCVFIFHSHYSE